MTLPSGLKQLTLPPFLFKNMRGFQADHFYSYPKIKFKVGMAGLFYLTPRRDCLVSPAPFTLCFCLTKQDKNSGALVSVALILYVHYIRRMGVTHYVVLWSPDFPPLTSSMSRATTFYLPCLSKTDSFTALFANLSAPRFSPRGICFIETCLKADIRCKT